MRNGATSLSDLRGLPVPRAKKRYERLNRFATGQPRMDGITRIMRAATVPRKPFRLEKPKRLRQETHAV